MELSASIAGRVARESYGRLLAFLAAQSRDFFAAEDALSDAFAAALDAWPRDGIPINPEAWLLTVARRRIADGWRRRRVVSDAAQRLLMAIDELSDAAENAPVIPDDRLKLMYVCAHPAIDEAARTPLMLQTVFGLDAARIAAVFVTTPATMSQRLVRAKAKIRDARIAFEIPDAGQVAERTQAVLDAVYAAYAFGRDASASGPTEHGGLVQEAIWLARLVASLLPENPEALGILALILFCESRRDAGRDTTSGRYVPLSMQDCARWSAPLIAEAEATLKRAARLGAPGRYQIEAAIQSVHADRARTAVTDWRAILCLYDGLLVHAPTIGARVARASVVAEIEGPAAGLRALEGLERGQASRYQPFWAVFAALSGAAQDTSNAIEGFERAIALTDDPAVRDYLTERQNLLRH